MGRRFAISVLAGGLVLAGAAPALATDAGVLAAARLVGRVDATSASLSGSDPSSIQAAYDAARDLQEAVRAAGPADHDCRALAGSLATYAAARISQAEGYDRPSSAQVSAGARRASQSRARISTAGCRSGGGRPVAARLPMSPSSGAAFFGPVVARAPAGADTGALVVDGREVARGRLSGGRLRTVLSGGSGAHDIEARFYRRGRLVGTTVARDAYLLPPSAKRAAPGSRTDAAKTASVLRALSGGPTYRAAFVQDLSSGSVAAVNPGGRFPAASTVKLGLLVGSLARVGPNPERGRLGYDLKAMVTWSSNLATNRILRTLGTSTATDGLRRLEATHSTFTGEYIVGTELQPSLPSGGGSSAPSVSQRVTTAEDLARMLYGIQAAAAGSGSARRQLGIGAQSAQLALGWLLGSQQRGDNQSLLAPGLPSGTPIAQKNGWLNDARHSAAIVYTARGPVIVVLLTYDDAGVSLARARTIGARLAALA